MTTFTMQDLNEVPVTKEEEEAMDALSRLGAGVPFGYVGEGKTAVFDAPQINAPDTTPTPPTLETIIANICTQLQLLTTVIKEWQEKGNSHGEKSLQECLDATLQQAEWFKEMVEERIDEQVDDKDMSYAIESAVEDHFSNSFSLDDHVDITAEVESKVEDIAEDLLRDIVEERLAEIVSNKLQNLRITFD